MFSIGQKVVYPGHGVAQIVKLVTRVLGGISTDFFELKFLSKDMTILVPVRNAVAVGVRPLSSLSGIEDVLTLLQHANESAYNDAAVMNWNKRNKEYQGKIRTGDLREICEIYRDLKYIENFKELSFGEKSLLGQAEALLVEEIALVNDIREDKAIEKIRSCASSLKRLGGKGLQGAQ
jgi:CarD family transcriptional regulator